MRAEFLLILIVSKTLIVNTVKKFSESLDKGVQVDAVVIDFAKAFDVVPHDILIRKLVETNIDKRVVLWIREFLTNRTQRVKVGSKYSDEVSITSRVV